MNRKEIHMGRAIELARVGMWNGDGGPFGAVIVRDDKVVGEGWNRVLAENDPTAHGEVVAIRNACLRAGQPWLEGCEIYTTGEPCPMCLGAIHWARIERIYYGLSTSGITEAGFDDDEFHSEFAKPREERRIPSEQVSPERSERLLREYLRLPGREIY